LFIADEPRPWDLLGCITLVEVYGLFPVSIREPHRVTSTGALVVGDREILEPLRNVAANLNPLASIHIGVVREFTKPN
jgi:hypothetical protein